MSRVGIKHKPHKKHEGFEYRKKDKVYATSKTGYRGVSLRNDCNRYRVQLIVKGRRHHVGHFKTLEAAVIARDIAEAVFRAEAYGVEQ